MLKCKTCLLIDDDHDDQLIFELALKQVSNSMLCVTASNGNEGLEKLEGNDELKPDYIFLDLNMQGMSGIECLIRIKKHIELQYIPVIIYTTSSDQKDIIETGALGASAFITKPNDIAELTKKLEGLFNF